MPSWALLVAGVTVIALSGMRWNIAALAWVAPVLFLLYLRREERRGRWLDEGGFSILRPARAATSWAFDAYGRARASLPFFEDNDRVMLATLPTERVPTLYARIGDLPALVYAFVLAGAAVAAWRRRAVLGPVSGTGFPTDMP